MRADMSEYSANRRHLLVYNSKNQAMCLVIHSNFMLSNGSLLACRLKNQAICQVIYSNFALHRNLLAYHLRNQAIYQAIYGNFVLNNRSLLLCHLKSLAICLVIYCNFIFNKRGLLTYSYGHTFYILVTVASYNIRIFFRHVVTAKNQGLLNWLKLQFQRFIVICRKSPQITT